ncbi:MAG: DUF3617 family protein [Rhodocyclaceae bacterium]|nr:DUF3617 family protein [Rhodocyclaceae bacterium]
MRILKPGTVALAATLAATSVAAVDLPRRKPGLWEIQTEMSVMGGQRMTMRQCIDEKTDANLMAEATKNQGDCDEPVITRSGNRIEVRALCHVEGGTASTHGVFTGEYDSRYQGEILTTFDPPQHGMKEARMKIDGRWTGPCEAGQKPGATTMQIPGLGNIDVGEMMKKMPGMQGR